MESQVPTAIVAKLFTTVGAVVMFVSLFLDFYEDGRSGWEALKSLDIVITVLAAVIFLLSQLSLALPVARARAVLAELTIPVAFFALGEFLVDGSQLEVYGVGGFLGIGAAGFACFGALLAAAAERLFPSGAAP